MIVNGCRNTEPHRTQTKCIYLLFLWDFFFFFLLHEFSLCWGFGRGRCHPTVHVQTTAPAELIVKTDILLLFSALFPTYNLFWLWDKSDCVESKDSSFG